MPRVRSLKSIRPRIYIPSRYGPLYKLEIVRTDGTQIGRAHVWTPVTFLYLVCRLLLEKKKKKWTKKNKNT